jgi:hypothetical protein
MTSGIRLGSMSVDGTPISRTDLARIEAEEKLNEDLQRKTVRVIAGAARDAAECRVLLDMLGIDSAVVASARVPHKPVRAAKQPVTRKAATRKSATAKAGSRKRAVAAA